MTSPESSYALLYRYLLDTEILHAFAAELYQGEQLIAKTRPIHCGALTDRVLRMHLQSLLETFSQRSGEVISGFQEIIDVPLSQFSCPVADCHLNAASRLEELL